MTEKSFIHVPVALVTCLHNLSIRPSAREGLILRPVYAFVQFYSWRMNRSSHIRWIMLEHTERFNSAHWMVNIVCTRFFILLHSWNWEQDSRSGALTCVKPTYIGSHYWNGMRVTIYWAPTRQLTLEGIILQTVYFKKTYNESSCHPHSSIISRCTT